MPILEVHLVEGMYTPTQHAHLLSAMSTRCSEVLDAPLSGVRVILTLHRPEHWVVGGLPGVAAPYFTALLLQGRTPDQRRRLLGALTDLLVDLLGVDRGGVRGLIQEMDPANWAIGGVPVAVARRSAG